MNIELVVFDLAGTTVQDEGNIADVFADAMNAYGYQVPLHSINALMGYKKAEAILMMLKEYEPDKNIITASLVQLIHERFTENMIRFYSTATINLLPNVAHVLGELKKKGVKIGVTTGFSRDITNALLARVGWSKGEWIDYIVTSDEVARGRPYPYMIHRMMEEAGIQKSGSVVKVGDTEADVNEGKNAGCKWSIAVTTGAFTRKELERYAPSFILDDMSELLPILEQEA